LVQAFKHSILTWLGILGGALTLLSNLQGVLDLAKWADRLILIWSELVTPIISGLIELFGIRVSTEANSMIAMAIFVSFIAIGARIENSVNNKTWENWPVRWKNIFNGRVLLATALYFLEFFLIVMATYVPIVAKTYLTFPYFFIAIFYALYCGAIITGLKGWPLWTSVIVAISMMGFSFIFGHSTHAVGQPNVSESASAAIACVCAVLCGFIVVGIAPPVAFAKRVIFMAFGFLSIIALSKISQLGSAISL